MLVGQAAAVLGMSATEFFELDFNEYYEALRIKRERDAARDKIHMQITFEAARFKALLLINNDPWVPRQYKYKSLKDLCEFDWDKDHQTKRQTVEEMKQQIMKFALYTKAKFIKREDNAGK